MENLDNKNNQRNRPSQANDSVDDEVQKLFRKSNGKISSSDFSQLKKKYNDVELVEKIQKAYLEKQAVITKKAKKFAQLIRDKYSNQQYPFHVLLEKARLFKVKHDLSDDEFAEFQRIYEQELVGLKSPEVLSPTTNMMKVLGSISVDFGGQKIEMGDSDYKYLQEILKLEAASKPLHAQVLLQSIQYNDCDFEALSGEYRRELGHIPGQSVHPVIAALFLPKINHLESHFLHSNIAGIVKARYNGDPLVTKPDYELFYSLTNDPNDVVCDNKSSVLDLLNRAQIQNQLWNNVLNLRNGQYYNAMFRDFISSIDVCKLNKFDNPDLIYGRYDGTIIKRLLSAFSFRPTIVSTLPIYNMVVMNPYQQNVRPIVTAVPMINLRLPNSINDDTPVELDDALEQGQIFFENGTMVQRTTSLIYSRGILLFYVDRRANTIRYNDIQPFNVSRLPISISGFERIHKRVVEFKNELTIRGEMYHLRSVVLAEVNSNTSEGDIVVGSSTIIMIHPDHAAGMPTPQCFQYDPIGVSDTVLTAAGTLEKRNPVSQINSTPGIGPEGTSFQEQAQTRGIIFMYELIENSSAPNKGTIVY